MCISQDREGAFGTIEVVLWIQLIQTIYFMYRSKHKGFTLVELMVVISIIALLTVVVMFSVSAARSKGRDAQRISDLKTVAVALELYHAKYGTYKVTNSGANDGGIGWLSVSHDENNSYTRAVSDVLYQEGFLSDPDIMDPLADSSDWGYMIYLCNGGQEYSLSATLENPTDKMIEYIQTTCNGTGANGTYTRYGKNYAIAE